MEKNTTTTVKTVAEILMSNTGLTKADDGTTRGRFTALTEKVMDSKPEWDAYKLHLASATLYIGKALAADSEDAAAQERNKAADELSACYAILSAQKSVKAICPAGVKLQKKHVRAWIAAGVFARFKVNYETCEKSVNVKSWRSVQRVVEMDFSDALNGRERLTRVVQNAASCKVITDAAQRAADAAKKPQPEPAPAKSKGKSAKSAKDPQPQPETQPAK